MNRHNDNSDVCLERRGLDFTAHLASMGVSLEVISGWSLEATRLDHEAEAARLSGDEQRRQIAQEELCSILEFRNMCLAAIGAMVVQAKGIDMGDFDCIEAHACVRWNLKQAIKAMENEESTNQHDLVDGGS